VNILDRYAALAPKILGIFRFLAGVLFALHGAQKAFGLFGGIPPGVPPFIKYGVGGVEVLGGTLIALGLLTRPAAFFCSGLMSFAYFIGHAGNGFWPNVNGGELALLFCWFFLYLSAQGPGAFALDNLRRRAPAV
jgi:putative oxidoreductase